MSEPAITSKNAGPKVDSNPAKPTAFTNEPVVTYDNVVAKPLRTPNFLNLKHKRPNMSLYWGNRAVGEKESTLRYHQLIAMGFEPCKPDEITDQNGKPVPEALIRSDRVIYGDLILLKIPKADYLGALKYNALRAMARVKKFGVAMEGRAAHQTAESRDIPRSVFADLPSKVQPYIPPLADIDTGTNMADK
jgi:hypothetical protein